ncbi:MAG TPA: APC family permease [Streptosporangiaceae bacterium]|nr:APC family permease [Streptosporangiaceae bacterium]
MHVGQSRQGKVGELRHGVLGGADAVAQSLALLALTFAVSAAPALAAGTAGAAVPVAYVIAGVGSLCLASVIVRFTRRIAHAGGLYTYTVRGLGPEAGFVAGWLYAIAFAVGISFVLIIAADFLSIVLTANTSVHLGWFPLYCILLALLLLIALADIRISTRIQLVFAVIGVLTIVALSFAIVAKGGANGLTWRPFDPRLSPSGHGLALAVILAFTGYIGFEAAAVLGEEASRPRRVIPRAIFGTVVIATVYFIFVTWAQAVGYGVAGAGRWAADPTALATLSDRYVGHWFSTLVDIVVAVDAFVAALAGVHLTARTLFAMGRDRGIPRVFAATTPRFRSPYLGIVVSIALTFVLGAWLGRHYGVGTYFALMATTASLGILFVYALVALGGMAFFWRVRHQQGESYNVVLDVVLPLIAVAICGYAIYSTLVPRPPAPISYSAWIALAWLAAGVLVVALLLLTRREQVRTFGKAFDTTEVESAQAPHR